MNLPVSVCVRVCLCNGLRMRSDQRRAADNLSEGYCSRGGGGCGAAEGCCSRPASRPGGGSLMGGAVAHWFIAFPVRLGAAVNGPP